MSGKKIKPISPAEAEANYKILPEVVQAVNELITEKYKGKGSFTLMQNEVINRIMKFCKANKTKMTREKLFDEHHMDFETYFEKEGWKIIYDKPGYNETYEASFKFTPKKNK